MAHPRIVRFTPVWRNEDRSNERFPLLGALLFCFVVCCHPSDGHVLCTKIFICYDTTTGNTFIRY